MFSKKFKVGIIGATGMVGQRFVSLLQNHPWFEVAAVAASSRSSGKTYEQALGGRWCMEQPIPDNIKNMPVFDACSDIEKIVSLVDFVFCAVNMNKSDIVAMEERYARAECPVISNNSACRWFDDVPVVIPEINPEHFEIIHAQRKRLGTSRGFITAKSNCSIQSYVPALHALMSLCPIDVKVCTYQAISGAGKTFSTWPEISDNVIPFISGEEEKSELEPLKVWGKIQGNSIINASLPKISAQCIRVPVSNGHLAAVFAKFDKAASAEKIIELWNDAKGIPQELNLPSAPKHFITYFDEPDRPQTKLDRNLENGMGISVGRLRVDSPFDVRFVSLSHNTVRGAAGGAILNAELLCAKGFI